MKARFAIDTEFNEFGGDLISLALVDIDYPDKKPFYEVLECRHPGEWVAVHVMPILNKPAITTAVFRRLLAGFLAKYSAVHIVGTSVLVIDLLYVRGMMEGFKHHLITYSMNQIRKRNEILILIISIVKNVSNLLTS